MDDQNVTTSVEPAESQPQPEAETPFVPAPPIESRFLFVDVAALRAKQLRRGALPRLPELHDAAAAGTAPPRKPERIAMEEVRQGRVPYELPGDQPETAGGRP